VTGEQAGFGIRLRRERERREISLAAVAESTKIAQSLLASLERGDASHWPPGIYRRAFLREYTSALGLPYEPVAAEFIRLFPESGAGIPEGIELPDASGLRLTLARGRRWSAKSLATQAAGALIDALIVVAAGLVSAGFLGLANWTVVAMVAITYYSLGTAVFGRSPALSLVSSVGLHFADRTKAQARRPSSRELLHIVTPAARPPRPPVEREFTIVAEEARIASR
jgi:transcriptional regulator with XRE-family HTH domain